MGGNNISPKSWISKNTYYRQKHKPSIIWHTLVITSANTTRKQHLPEHKNKNQHNIHDSGITSTTNKNSTNKIGDLNICYNRQKYKPKFPTTSNGENILPNNIRKFWMYTLSVVLRKPCWITRESLISTQNIFCFQRNLNLVQWKTFYILFSYLAVIVSHIYYL